MTTTRSLANALPWSVVQAIVPQASKDADSILALCLRVGYRPHSADSIATWLYWDRKTIYRELIQQRVRPIHDVINIDRLLHAARHLDESAASINAIAQHLCFDSLSTLRRL